MYDLSHDLTICDLPRKGQTTPSVYTFILIRTCPSHTISILQFYLEKLGPTVGPELLGRRSLDGR